MFRSARAYWIAHGWAAGDPTALLRRRTVAADLHRPTGPARLSYRRATALFTAATAGLPGGPWTLHQLRHSALTHATEEGASTSPKSPQADRSTRLTRW